MKASLTAAAVMTLSVFTCASRAGGGDADGIELLKDPALSKGITQGYANNLSPAERKDCQARWTAQGMGAADWAFWEIGEKLLFAHNPATPTRGAPGEFAWRTADDAKQCLVANGSVRMVFDTAREWREGGSLALPSKDGTPPRYSHGNTIWPHFLIGQHLAPDNSPTAPIADDRKVRFDRYDRLRFTADVKLNRLAKNSEWDHRAEFKAPNHAIFYVAFVAMPVSASRVADEGKFYIIVPAIYSEGGARHVAACHPWLSLDQAGDEVYFTGSQPALRAGAWVRYDTDVKQLIREAFAAATRQSRLDGKPETFVPEEHFLALVLIGWEVWGGFDTDVEFKNLSLRGWPSASSE